MNSYQIYQAERHVSRSEQLAADAARGEMARALSSLLRGGRDRRAADADQWPAGDVPCYPPAEWLTAGAR
jgi:hypothetical protein